MSVNSKDPVVPRRCPVLRGRAFSGLFIVVAEKFAFLFKRKGRGAILLVFTAAVLGLVSVGGGLFPFYGVLC